MKRALVLSGGGAKGAYQIGVYKALKRLHIKIHIITGTSIGSINGAALVSNDYRKAKKFWLNAETSKIFNYDFTKPENFPKVLRELILNKGLKLDRAEELLSNVLNERKIRKSKIDYGLVTVNLNTRTPKMLTKEEIPNGKLISYIIASASCFPAVEPRKIDGESYIDGGYYDNMPINLAIQMGADEIIAVDLNAIGIKNKKLDKDVKVDHINASTKGFFSINFDPKFSRDSILIGYYDTLKHFNKLDGDKYTFKKGQLIKNYNKVKDNYIKLLKKFLLSDNDSLLTGIIKNRRYKKILLNIKDNTSLESEVNSSIEYLADIFDLDRTNKYAIRLFNRIIKKKAKELQYITLDKNLKGKMLIGYIYNKYLEDPESSFINNKLLNIALVFPKDFLAALYLIVISSKYPFTSKSDSFYNEILDKLKK